MQIAAPLNHELTPALQRIEVATFFQIPSFQIIGLPAPEVCEARERIRAAIEASGLEFPRRRVVINLSPASVRKRGTGLDLAMALAILTEAERDSGVEIEGLCVAWGELGLDGTLRSTAQLTRAIYAAWQGGARKLVLPSADAARAAERLATIRAAVDWEHPAPGLHFVHDLREAWDQLSGRRGQPIARISVLPAAARVPTQGMASELMLLPLAVERMIGVASAGGHHLLLLGPKGAGKSHALDWIAALRGPASPQIRLRRLLIAELGDEANVGDADAEHSPLRKVGANARPGSLVGRVSASGVVRPGECTLAHGGVLIADELPEWARDTREALREPLERALVTLTRAAGSVELPARFALAATGNLCPCGGWPPGIPLPVRSAGAGRPPRCDCKATLRRAYLARLSGPVLDRIDVLLMMTFDAEANERGRDREAVLAALRTRAEDCRSVLREKWGALPGELGGSYLETLLADRPDWVSALALARVESARSRHKVLRVAMSLAAWDGVDLPAPAHFAEAACYRPERYALGR